MRNKSNYLLNTIEATILLLWFLIYFHVKIPFYYTIDINNRQDDVLLGALRGIKGYIESIGFIGASLLDLVLNILNILIIRWCFRVQKLGLLSLTFALFTTMFITMPVQNLLASENNIYLYAAIMLIPSYHLNIIIILLYDLRQTDFSLGFN